MAKRWKTVDELRQVAEAELETSSERAEPLLEELIALAEAGSEPAVFAHRHLAEMRLEADPWRAALHLRQVMKSVRHDDMLHALMGLCQALLGNFRMAASQYRRALHLSPQTPWYHHNLGHLLDVALDNPQRARSYLKRAYALEPDHDEIIGSLAHCLARVGELDEAKKLAKLAKTKAPRNKDHDDLLTWIEAGLPDDRRPSTTVSRAATIPESDEVMQLVQSKMDEAGFPPIQIERAKILWADVQLRCRLRVVKPEVCAAALEYAIAFIHRRPGNTQAAIARRYGVAPTSVSTRYGQMRDGLALRPGDPRYAS